MQITNAGVVNGITSVTLASILNYGTSASSSSAVNQSALRVCFGNISVGANSTQAITNLPFSGATTYQCTVSYSPHNDIADVAGVTKDSGSQMTIFNGDGNTRTISWIAIGY